MKFLAAIFSLFLFIIPLYSQEQSNSLTFKFYGFVRGDVFFDSRQSVASSEGLLFLYPKDIDRDAVGEDLNAQGSLGIYGFNSRPGVDISGLRVFNSDVTARIEADFAGFGGAYGTSTVLRIRHAYMKMQWKSSALTIGQAWHPFFGHVFPGQISLNTGAPFQPFSRNPQIRFDYKVNNITLSGATISQLQMNSSGPEGKSNVYQKNALLPELAAIIDYTNNSFTAGAGVSYLTLKPRIRSQWEDKLYKVNEKISSLSYTAYLKYTYDLFSASLRTVYGQNTSSLTMLGGYGIRSINETTGEKEYTNLTQTSNWLNLTYGNKYRGNLFIGYSKNLGSKDALVENSVLYGEGLNIKDLSRIAGTFSYNIPHFSLGAEYEFSHANYGDEGTFNWEKGTYSASHGVNNHRILGVISYIF